MVIAIRGTVPAILENDIVDVKSWWRSVFDNNAKLTFPEEYFSRALLFYRQAQRYAREHLGLMSNKVYVTGHSIGGAVAALLPAHALILSKAVTFNAPGVFDMPDLDPCWHDVANFRLTYDFISSLDKPIGPLWSINVPEEYKPAEKVFEIAEEHKKNGWSRLDIVNDIIESADFLESVVPQHSMANFLQALITNYKDAASDNYGILETGLEAVVMQAEDQEEKLVLNSPFIAA